ncbi:MAG: hypothetical protein JWR26_501 [Pedosphaera sp.]|nr:hypothetical protein [Pedosphaera sp.]
MGKNLTTENTKKRAANHSPPIGSHRLSSDSIGFFCCVFLRPCGRPPSTRVFPYAGVCTRPPFGRGTRGGQGVVNLRRLVSACNGLYRIFWAYICFILADCHRGTGENLDRIYRIGLMKTELLAGGNGENGGACARPLLSEERLYDEIDVVVSLCVGRGWVAAPALRRSEAMAGALQEQTKFQQSGRRFCCWKLSGLRLALR